MQDFSISPLIKPVMGIFVKTNHVTYLHTQNTNARISAILSAMQMAKITIYYFTLSDVDLQAKRISGTYFDDATGLWSKGLFPYPDVLYTRGGSIKQREKFNVFNKQLGEMGVKRINAGPVFNKWDVSKVLQQNSKVAPHLPDTVLYTAAKDLLLMLEKYGEIYLKACRGRKGMQVIRVKKLHPDYFEYGFYRNDTLYKDVVSFPYLMILINRFFGKRPFLVQQAINLPRLSDSIYDLRAEAQRNGKGELEIVEILVRVSQPGAPITTHASSYLFEDFFAGTPRLCISTSATFLK